VRTKNNSEARPMNPKAQRLSIIRKIIRSEYISSQEELIKRLEECGVLVTQSTLSRDLKYMHVAKVPHKDKGYIYILPNQTHNDHVVSTNISDNITDIAFSGNMCVITTKSGYASAISVPIDNKGISEVLGSIAGDNTILLILREGYRRDVLLEQLCEIFPSLSLIIAR
jgi:transcriptional regulator of arginine metabolism